MRDLEDTYPRVALTGASGAVGGYLLEALQASGAEVTSLGRSAVPGAAHQAYELGDAPDLAGQDVLIHAAFAHVPGRYRGGEGDDPDGFRARNLDGSCRLFDAAGEAGVSQIVFLSSRAVYGAGGDLVDEAAACTPDSLYGEVKLGCEAWLEASGLAAASLRATGVYGPGKWRGLVQDYLSGEEIKPRAGTEVRGEDLAAAALLVLGAGAEGAFNVSDLVVDRRDLLSEVQARSGAEAALPEYGRAPGPVMDSGKLRAMGWKPAGWPGVAACVEEILEALGPAEDTGPG